MTALRTTTIALSLSLLFTGSALAGPPLATDDAGTVDVGKAEIELNSSYTHDKESAAGVSTRSSTFDSEMKITTGLYKNLGFSVAIPYTISQRVKENDQLIGTADGFGDMTVELKYAFAKACGTTLAIKPAIIIPTGKYSAGLSDGRWQLGTTLIATREFAEGTYALHVNLGYAYHNYRNSNAREAMRSDLWSGSVAGEAKLMKGLTAVVDFGLATNPDKQSDELPVYALTGVRYEIDDHLEANAGVKVGLTKPEDDISVLYGLVLKF